MSEVLRQFTSRFRGIIFNRRMEPRYISPHAATLTLIEYSEKKIKKKIALPGLTHDLSLNGLGVLTNAIRVEEFYLTATDSKLQVSLKLPDRTVEVIVEPKRYNPLEPPQTEFTYIIGLRIIGMSEVDRSAYNDYIKALRKGNAERAPITP